MPLAALTETAETGAELLDFWTPEGLRVLGRLIRYGRSLLVIEEKRGLSQRELSAFLEQCTGHFVSDRTIGNLENGQVEPKHNTVVIFAAARFLRHPHTQQILSREAINAIACGRFDPYREQSNGAALKLSQLPVNKSAPTDVTFLRNSFLQERGAVVSNGYGFDRFIQDWCRRQAPPLSEADFLRLVETAIQDYEAVIDLERIRQVCWESRSPTEEEVGFLGTILRDEQGLPYDYSELIAIAGLQSNSTQPANYVDD